MYIIKLMYIITTGEKVKTNIEPAKFEKSSSINLKYLKVDNSFQYFAKCDRFFYILLGDKCLREIFKSSCELLFPALIALATIEFLP